MSNEEEYGPVPVVLIWKPNGAVTVTGAVNEVAVTVKGMNVEVEFTCWLPKFKAVGFAVMVGVPDVPVPVRFSDGDDAASGLPLPVTTEAVKDWLVEPVPVGLKCRYIFSLKAPLAPGEK